MNQAMTPAGEPLEIERKFLIRRPDRALLERHSTGCLVMEQIYLTRRQKGESRRIRQSTREGQTLYYYNEKVRLSSIKRIEREWEISRAEYEALQREADPDCAVIRKERWLIPAGALTLEVDVFPFWAHQAFCEAELTEENQPVELPAWMELLREVTDEDGYTNPALARHIPAEDEAAL